MAKLAYNEELVDESLSLLKQAETQIANTGNNVVSALSTIAGARGANYLDMNSMIGAGGLNESCIQLIEETVSGINARVEMIQEYNEDYENAGFFKKVFSTVGLIATKFSEGLFGAGEQIVDGFASGAGFVLGILGQKDAKEAIGEFVKKDHVGDYYKNLYDGALSDMVKYSAVKEDGFVANAAKIFGTSAGYTAALALTGGIVGATTGVASGAAVTGAQIFNSGVTGAKVLMGSVKAAATMAGIGGMGMGTQAAMQSGKTFDQAVWTGLKTAAIQAGTVIVVDWGIKKIAKAWSNFKSNKAAGIADDVAGTADDAASAAGQNNPTGPQNGPTGGGSAKGAMKNADDFLNATGKSADEMADDLINAVKNGEVSADDAMAAFNKKCSSATTRDGKVQWHPDKFQARVDAAAKAANAAKAGATAASAADDIAGAADDMAGAAGKNNTGPSADYANAKANANTTGKGGTSSGASSSGGTNATGTNPGGANTGPTAGGTTPNAGAGAKVGQSADDILNASGKSADEVIDDLYNAVKNGDIDPADAKAAIEAKFKQGPSSGANRKDFMKQWHPDEHSANIDELAKIAKGETPISNDVIDAARKAAKSVNQNGGSVEDAINAARDAAIKAGGNADEVAQAMEVAKNVAKPQAAPGQTPNMGTNPSTPPKAAATNPGQTAVGKAGDEIIDAATGNGGAPTTGPAPKTGGDAIPLGGSSSPATNPIASTGDEMLESAANAAKPPVGNTNAPTDVIQLGGPTTGTNPIANAGDELLETATNAGQVSDDLANAMKDYDDLLFQR